MNVITILYSIAVLGAIVMVSHGAQLKSNETEAKIFAQQVSEKLFNLYDIIGDAAFADDASESYDYEAAVRNTTKVLTEIAKGSKEFDSSNFNDVDLQHTFLEINRSIGDTILGEDRYWQIASLELELEELAKEPINKGYHNDSDELAYDPDIKKIIAESNDPDELKYYWLEWNNRSADKREESLRVQLMALRDAANLTEMPVLDYYMSEYYMTQMENVMEDIKPLYKEIHAFVRNQLQKKYGGSVIKDVGLIPVHLYEQVLAQILGNNSIVEELYPHENLPPYESVLKNRFEPESLLRIIDRFYEKLGFTPFPHNYWGDRIKINKNEEDDEDDCDGRVYYKTPKIYLEYCQKMNFKKFLDAYSDMGKIYYAKEMTGLPAYYFDTNDLQYAIGKAAMLSASTLRNLKAIGMIVNVNVTEEMEMNRLLRLSIQTLLSIPVEFVQAKYMKDLLSEDVDTQFYWDLMKEYVGVGPPEDRAPDAIDFPLSFFTDIRQAKVNFEAEVLGYQIYKKLCEISGKYPKEALQKCDIHGSKDAGKALKKMMSLGTTKSYDDAIGTMFPDDQTIKSEALLEYFNPMKKFLAKNNHESNVKTGW